MTWFEENEARLKRVNLDKVMKEVRKKYQAVPSKVIHVNEGVSLNRDLKFHKPKPQPYEQFQVHIDKINNEIIAKHFKALKLKQRHQKFNPVFTPEHTKILRNIAANQQSYQDPEFKSRRDKKLERLMNKGYSEEEFMMLN